MDNITPITANNYKEVADVLLNCMKCNNPFGEKKVPKNLTCGHTLCSVCIKEIVDTDAHCLECRTRLVSEDVDDLAINYSLLKCVRSINENPSSLKCLNAVLSKVPRFRVIAPEYCSSKDSLKCSKHCSPTVVFCLTCRSWACQDCMVLDHPSPPHGTCKILSFEKALQEMKTEYERNVNVSVKRLKLIERNLAPEEARIALLTNVCPIENEHTKFTDAIMTYFNDIQKMDETTINDVKAVLRKLLKSVRKTTSLKKMNGFQEKLISQEKVLKDYIKLEEERKITLHQEIRLHLALDLKVLADSGTPLYTAQHVIRYSSSVTRWAQIVSKENHLLVTCLQEGKVPDHGITIPYDYIRDTVSKAFPSVFFEFGNADDESSDLVVVRLRYNVNTQVPYIVHYCSGEGEKNYKGSALFKKTNKNGRKKLKRREMGVVYGGDLEKNDGTGSNDTDDDSFHYKQPVPWISHKCTFSCEFYSTSKFAFLFNPPKYLLRTGWITSGVHFLRKLCDSESITGMIVKDCGFVMYLGEEEIEHDSDDEDDDYLDLHPLFS